MKKQKQMMTVIAFCLVAVASAKTQTSQALPNDAKQLGALAPSAVVPNTIGIFIHDLTDKNLDRARQAGFSLIRTDLNWGEVEQTKGQYNWAYYDPIIKRLGARGQRPLFSLGFNNPLYGAKASGGDPYMDAIDTPLEREGFKNFAVAAVKRYQSLISPIWEIHNEPNRDNFWSKPSSLEYVKLVKAVAPAMRQASPDVYILGPAVGHAPSADAGSIIKIDLAFLEGTFANGLLNYVDAVSIHPYPDGRPEYALGIYKDVRVLINTYAPGKIYPIVSSEWGYSSSADFSGNDQTHSNYLTRMYLLNLSQQVLSIGYKLEEYSFDPNISSYELAFGWYTVDGKPKVVYSQVQKMIRTLRGLSFVKRLPSAPDDYVLEFANRAKTIAAVWTTGSAHTVTVYGKTVEISGEPMYVTK
jgi:polysaccharide biosynthesis protein PslG